MEEIKQNNNIETTNKSNGAALASFILSFVAITFATSAVLGVPGMVLGIVGLSLSNRSKDTNNNPYRTFRRISHGMSIASIVIGAVMTTLIVVTIFVLSIMGIIQNAYKGQ